MLIVILTLFFILSVTIVSAEENISTENFLPQKNNDFNYMHFENNHQMMDKNHRPKSVSKDFDFFGLFNWGNEKKYGYWVWASDMNKVDFDKLSDNGVNVIFLNSFAFTEYGQRDVLDWIKKANDHGIEVHVWMQIFNTGGWISPLKNGTPDSTYFNYKIEEARYYAGLEGVSGIQMDYIRFEGNAYEYENGTKAINTFVENFTKAVRAENHDLTISATVMPETDKDEYYYGQDITTIRKYVDVIVPMLYKGNYKENTSWIKNTTEWFVNNSGDAKVWCGLQTYESDSNITHLSSDEMINDANKCFDGGSNGVMFFRWGMNEDLDNKKLN